MRTELELIEELTKERSRASADKLQELERIATHREIRKAARKALYTLSQIGIVPGKLPPSGQAAEAAKKDTLRAFASAYDGAGNRLILFLAPDRDGGSATLIQILTNDTEGVQKCETLKLRRREVDERINIIKSQVETGLAVAEIDPDFSRWLLASARSLSASLSRRSPDELLSWMSKIGEPVSEYAPPIYTRVTEEEIMADSSVVSDPAELFKLIWFDPWFFAAEDAVPWLPQWEQAITEAGDQPDMSPGTAIDKIVTDAANGLMTDSMRRLYIRRLEETADVLWRCGKECEAKQALYHAVTLHRACTEQAAGIPFAHAIALRTLGAAFEMVRAYRERRAGG